MKVTGIATLFFCKFSLSNLLMIKKIFIPVLFFLFQQLLPLKSFAQAPVTDTATAAGETYALIVGISSYKYIRPLSYADKDAELLRDFLKSPGGGSVKTENMFCLLNEEAKAANFWVKGMAWLRSKQMKKGDRLFLYLAGHGDAINQDEYFFLTYDCNPAGDKNNYIVTGSVQLYNLKSRIAELSRKGVEVIFIMDACRTNELPGGSEGQQTLNAAISEKQAGEIIMLATGAGQESLEDASIGRGHGLFTYYMVDGLSGNADSLGVPDKKITLSELKKYIDINVPSIAKEKYRRKQDPFICCDDNSQKFIANVDTNYLRKWNLGKLIKESIEGKQLARNVRGRGLQFTAGDSTAIELYNLLNAAVKRLDLTGTNTSAEYYFNKLSAQFPNNDYTKDASQVLAAEFINFAQTKINLYLDGKDAATIQKIRTQLDEADQTEEISSTLKRMEKIASLDFYNVGVMLEKAIAFLPKDDDEFAKSLVSKLYFFKARGYYGQEKRFVNYNQALQYAFKALELDNKAAYVLNTISSLYMEKYNYDSTIYYAKQAIAFAPRWRYPYLNVAFCYKMMNFPDSALRYYNKAIEVNPGNADAYVDIGQFYNYIRKNDAAGVYYRSALKLDPINVYANNNLGWIYKEARKYDSAIICFKRSIELDPEFFNSYNGLSRVYIALKQYDSAKVYYEKAISNYADKGVANLYLGNFYHSFKLNDSAIACYKRAVQFDPNFQDAYIKLGKIFFEQHNYDSARLYYKKAEDADPSSALPLLNTGIVFNTIGLFDSASGYFKKAIKLDPFNPVVYNYIGVVYKQAKLYDSARIYLNKAININPTYINALNTIGETFTEEKNYDSASAIYNKVLQLFPANTSLLNQLGLSFLQQKKLDSARSYFNKVISIEPDNAVAYNNLAMVAKEKKNITEAKRLLIIAVDKDPAYITGLNNLGIVLADLKQYDSAVYYYRKALVIEKDNILLLNGMGNVYKNLKQYDSATLYYRKVIEMYPLEPFAVNNLGFLFFDMRQYDSSELYYNKAVAMDPANVIALNNLGVIYYNFKLYDSAIVFYKKAFAIDPNYANAINNLYSVYYTIKQYDEAIAWLLKAIKLNPKSNSLHYLLACSYSLNGQIKEGMDALEKAFSKGYKDKFNIMNDPDLQNLRKLPEFNVLLTQYFPDLVK